MARSSLACISSSTTTCSGLLSASSVSFCCPLMPSIRASALGPLARAAMPGDPRATFQDFPMRSAGGRSSSSISLMLAAWDSSRRRWWRHRPSWLPLYRRRHLPPYSCRTRRFALAASTVLLVFVTLNLRLVDGAPRRVARHGRFALRDLLDDQLLGKFSTISRVSMRSVRNEASRDPERESSILSGWSCSSIHLSTPSWATSLDVARPRTERQAIQRVDGSLLLVHTTGPRDLSFFLPSASWVEAQPGDEYSGNDQGKTCAQRHCHPDGPHSE